MYYLPMYYWSVLLCAFALTLLLTPLAGWVGRRLGVGRSALGGGATIRV